MVKIIGGLQNLPPNQLYVLLTLDDVRVLLALVATMTNQDRLSQKLEDAKETIHVRLQNEA